MLLRQEQIALGLLCAVTAAIILASVILGGINRESIARVYDEDTPDGALVRITGEVQDIRTTRTGGHLTARVNNISVFIPSGMSDSVVLENGDQVTIIGIASVYRGEKEVVVQSPDDIVFRKKEN